jgi:hypothetical protein
MHQSLCAFSLLSLLFAPAAQSAEISMRPGLWEVTTSSDLLWFVPQIPSDQMEGLKDLAKEYGLDMPKIENGSATSNTCITPEMANQKTPPGLYQSQMGCAAKNVTHIGNRYRLDFECAGEQLKGNGSAEGVFASTEKFTGQTRFNGFLQGSPVNEKADISGRWLSSSCGDVKPLQQ